jgi:tetratricopeptide (TPR) repeat protein
MIRKTRAIWLVWAVAAGLTALTMSKVALAGPLEDCEKLRGDAAIAACDQAIKANPRDVGSLGNRGFEYRVKGQFDRALADLNRALEIQPDHANNRGIRGGIHQDMDNLDSAIADYNEAIRLNPKSAAHYFDRGVAHNIKRNYDRAIADFSETIRIDPKHARAFDNRASAYRAKGDTARASADLGQAIRLNPNIGNVLIFFDYESSSMGQAGQQLIERVAEMFKAASAREIRIAAHTDTAEPNSEALSMARATSIRTALTGKGVPANAILIQGLGSTSLLVPTPKDTKEPQNRRAHVNIVP